METLEILDRNINGEYSINPGFLNTVGSIYSITTSEKKSDLSLFFEEITIKDNSRNEGEE